MCVLAWDKCLIVMALEGGALLLVQNIGIDGWRAMMAAVDAVH
jgi:hypothetical protein